MARNKALSSETSDYSMQEIAKKLKILYNAVYFSLHRTAQTGSIQNRKRSGRPRCTTEQGDKYIRVSSLRNGCLTNSQLAASLNSTRKTPVSTSTGKRRLRDAGLLCRYSIKNQPFPATKVIYSINNVYTVFLINLKLFIWTKK